MTDNAQNHAAPPPPQQPPASTGTRGWVRALLAVSLSLNLLVAGLVAGVYLRESRGAKAPSAPEARVMRELGLGPFLSAFPPEQRHQMARALRQQVGTFALNREALQAELAAMLSALRAEPYDHGALEVVVNRQKARIDARAGAGRDVILNQISAMSAEERLEFANRMERSLRRSLESGHRQGRP